MELNNMEGCICSKIIEVRYEFDPVVKRLCELDHNKNFYIALKSNCIAS